MSREAGFTVAEAFPSCTLLMVPSQHSDPHEHTHDFLFDQWLKTHRTFTLNTKRRET